MTVCYTWPSRGKYFGYDADQNEAVSSAGYFSKFLDAFRADFPASEIAVVAHSMGCILTRVALQGAPLSKLKRIVMLCPPDRGSITSKVAAGDRDQYVTRSATPGTLR